MSMDDFSRDFDAALTDALTKDTVAALHPARRALREFIVTCNCETPNHWTVFHVAKTYGVKRVIEESPDNLKKARRSRIYQARELTVDIEIPAPASEAARGSMARMSEAVWDFECDCKLRADIRESAFAKLIIGLLDAGVKTANLSLVRSASNKAGAARRSKALLGVVW